MAVSVSEPLGFRAHWPVEGSRALSRLLVRSVRFLPAVVRDEQGPLGLQAAERSPRNFEPGPSAWAWAGLMYVSLTIRSAHAARSRFCSTVLSASGIWPGQVVELLAVGAALGERRGHAGNGRERGRRRVELDARVLVQVDLGERPACSRPWRSAVSFSLTCDLVVLLGLDLVGIGPVLTVIFWFSSWSCRAESSSTISNWPGLTRGAVVDHPVDGGGEPLGAGPDLADHVLVLGRLERPLLGHGDVEGLLLDLVEEDVGAGGRRPA